MRIICENCGTKYSIADEKVRGKVFKIRCKKCGHIIVVKGAQEQAAPAADGFDEKETRVFDYSGFSGDQQGGGEEAVWHVVIDREQVGPLSDEQVRQKFAAGEIDVETFIWREGFADWVKLGGVEEFADLEDATVAAESPFSAGAAAPFGGGGGPAVTAENTPPAASEPEPMGGEPAAAASYSGGGGGLFGSPADEEPAAEQEPAQPGGSSNELFGSPSPGVAAAPATGGGGGHSLFPEEEEEDAPQPAMTGQRNENSVLFSLSNLQSLATGGPTRQPGGGMGGGGGGARPGAGIASAKTEGSGLLDIRAMAASTLGDSSSDSAGAGINVPSPFSSPMASPVLMPVSSSDRPGWLIPVLVLGGVLLVAVVVLGVVVVVRMGDDKSDPKKAEVAQKSNPAGAETKTEGAGGETGQPEKKVEGDEKAAGEEKAEAKDKEEKAAEGNDEKAEEEAGKKDEGKSSSRKSGRSGRSRARSRTSSGRSSSSKSGSSKSTSRPSPTPRPTRKTGGGSDDPLAKLLGSAGGSKTSRPAPRPRPRATPSKESLSRSDITKAIGRISGAVRGCYNKYKVTGLVWVRVTVSGSSGRVSSASVTGKFSGTPTGKCVARAVKRARFAKFSRSSQSFKYPFRLN